MRGVERTRIANEQVAEQHRSDEAQARIKVEQDRAKQEKAHQDAVLKATQATLNLNHIKSLQDIAGGIKSGVPVPGEQVQDVPGTAGAAQMHSFGSDENGKPFQLLLPSREEQMLQAQHEEEILQAPKTAAKIAETEAAKKADYDRFEMQKAADDKRAELMRKSQELIARGHDITSLEHARITASGKNQPTLDPDMMKPYVEGVIKGQYTLNELKKALPNKADFQSVMAGITGTNSVPFTDKQKNIRQDFGSAAQLIPQFDQIQDLINANPIASRTPFTNAHQLVQKQIAQVREKLINSLQAFGQGGRLSDTRVKALTEAFSPTLTPNAALANGQAKQNFMSYLSDAVDTHLGTVSKAQRDSVKADLGLVGIPSGMPKSPSGIIRARDANGTLHEAPIGSTLPQGWKLEPQTVQ